MKINTNLPQVSAYLAWLTGLFHGCKLPINEAGLRSSFEKKDIAAMVLEISKYFGIKNNLRLGMVSSGGPQAPAWTEVPESAHGISPLLFSSLHLTVCVRKTFVVSETFEGVAYCLAHELAHIAMGGVYPMFLKNERAVDLLAMLLGFSEIIARVAQSDGIPKAIVHDGMLDVCVSQRGYLSPAERMFAREVLANMRNLRPF